jgi:HEAT repeat protein
MEGQERQQQILRDLQKALEDPALEVVIEVAEDLGALGAPEAGPVLTGLLKHQSEPARQAAAQALERVADVAVLDRLVDALDDSSSAVRFSVLGAIDRAAGNAAPADALRQRLQSRLEDLLLHDADPGVRSRAATVLGECGSASQLQTLWRCVLTAEDGRVQEKAWAAFLEVLVRSGSLPLLQEWEHTLASVKQASRRLQLLNEVSARWMKNPERKLVAGPAQEILVQAQLEQGKWTAAYPQVRELLTRPASDVELSQRLQWLLTVGQQALQEGNKAEALRVAQEAQPYLYPGSTLSAEFQKLEKQATRKDKD